MGLGGVVFKSPEVFKVHVGLFNCDAPIREVCLEERGERESGAKCGGGGRVVVGLVQPVQYRLSLPTVSS